MEFESLTHHRTGTTWSPEVKAKISTSMIISKKESPDLWERLYRVTLERIKIIQEIHGTK
jgi:hypothetical protein